MSCRWEISSPVAVHGTSEAYGEREREDGGSPVGETTDLAVRWRRRVKERAARVCVCMCVCVNKGRGDGLIKRVKGGTCQHHHHEISMLSAAHKAPASHVTRLTSHSFHDVMSNYL
ncbi:unnamed protein product [Microthlaspi erraticum]|uniref:Uncharacterized protein n=1 Tax=Microthlaspi erraticum TaxID=1685480 RepID=A0A6D2HL67_9BRAS|nr:unnamed protein product [Microthlaspi erraticum]